MNYQKLVSYLLKYRFVFIFALLMAVVAGFWEWQSAGKFDVSLVLTVNRYGIQQSPDYRYDNYYALKASDEFSDTVAGWFETPEMAQAILKKTGLDSWSQNLNALSRRFKAAKIAPNLVEVRFSAQSEEEAKILAKAIGQLGAQKVDVINSASSQNISFLLLVGEPVIVKNAGIIWWNIFSGFLVGLAVGFFLKLGKEYFK